MIKSLEELIDKLKQNKTIKFKIKVSANSSINSIDFCEDFVRIKVKAPAVEGKANKAIIEYIAKLTGIAKSNIEIANGNKSAIKTICIKL